jgi:TonB family protein
MKAVSKSAVILSVGLLGSVVAQAMTPEQFYISTCRKEPGVPVPIEVVSPRVGPQYEGTTVHLEFVVDEHGKPTEITVLSAQDFTVGMFVSQAVSQWQFKPAMAEGKPVPMKVELPVKIVDTIDLGKSLAAK